MNHLIQTEFRPLNIAVLTISDTRNIDTDTSGQMLVDLLQEGGHFLAARSLVTDSVYGIRAEVSRWIADPQVQVVIMTGGTGFTERDNTPQAVMPLLDKLVDGFGEQFREVSTKEIGTSSMQSRALAGLANGTLICCLPGSTGACRTAWTQVLASQLDSRTIPCNFVPHLKRVAGAEYSNCAART